MKRLSILLTLVIAACGGSEKSTETPVTTTTPEPAAMEHPKLTPELDAFHETLKPRWHADKGEARMKDTCAAVPEFQTQAAAIKAAPATNGADPTAWATAGTELDATVTGLAAACTGTDVAAFDTAFEALHNAFHRAMELVAPEAHKEHGEHDMGNHADHH